MMTAKWKNQQNVLTSGFTSDGAMEITAGGEGEGTST